MPAETGKDARRRAAGRDGDAAGATAATDTAPAGASAAATDDAETDGAQARSDTESVAGDGDGDAAPAGDAPGDGGADGDEGRGDDNGDRDDSDAAAPGPQARRPRRFPLFTKDTARPEGGGRAASVDAPAPARQWPVLAVLSTAGLGLLLTAFDVFRVGTILIGVALLIGAALRRALPSVGMLAVRSRFTDMITYGVLGLAIVLLALMAQPDPWLEIPFLGDTLHFTIQ